MSLFTVPRAFVFVAVMASVGATHPASTPRLVVTIPRAEKPIALDGELGDDAWLRACARTGAFAGAGGAPARPHAEARLAWRDDALYVALYAADGDIRAARAPADGPRWLGGDTFELGFTTEGGEYRIEVSPDGVLTDAHRTAAGWDYAWQSGARTAHDADGTIGDPSDEDEEWVIEMAVPFRAMGIRGEHGDSFGLEIRRCDVAPSGPRTCTSWDDDGRRRMLVLD